MWIEIVVGRAREERDEPSTLRRAWGERAGEEKALESGRTEATKGERMRENGDCDKSSDQRERTRPNDDVVHSRSSRRFLIVGAFKMKATGASERRKRIPVINKKKMKMKFKLNANRSESDEKWLLERTRDSRPCWKRKKDEEKASDVSQKQRRCANSVIRSRQIENYRKSVKWRRRVRDTFFFSLFFFFYSE